MPTGPTLSDLFPHLFDQTPPQIEGKDPVILTGSYLRSADVHMLPGDDKAVPNGHDFSLANGYGGYAVLRRLSVSKPEDWYQMLWRPSGEFPTSIGVCGFGDSLERLLYIYQVTRFGVAAVKKGPKRNIGDLGKLVSLLKTGRFTTTMKTGEVGSKIKSLSSGSTIVDAVNMMIVNHVRRVFLQGSDGSYVSDRTLLDYLFSPHQLEAARDAPEKWAEGRLSDVKSKQPSVYQGESIEEAAGIMGEAPDDCLITGKGEVITRWDLVMKPWLAGRLATK